MKHITTTHILTSLFFISTDAQFAITSKPDAQLSVNLDISQPVASDVEEVSSHEIALNSAAQNTTSTSAEGHMISQPKSDNHVSIASTQPTEPISQGETSSAAPPSEQHEAKNEEVAAIEVEALLSAIHNGTGAMSVKVEQVVSAGEQYTDIALIPN